MTFLILSAAAGVILAVAPLWAARHLRERWKTPKGLFLKAGLALLIIEVIHLAAVGNATSLWPQIMDLPLYLRALILGAAAGLFMELGRFFVLDRMMKGVRSFKDGIYFGLGWNGLETVLLGIIILIGISGMQILATAPDLATQFPEATQAELEQVQNFQEQAAALMQGNPLLALAPVLERGSLLVIDVAMTLLILLGLIRGTTAYTWGAVGFRALFSCSLIFVSSISMPAGEAVFAVFAALAFLIARQIRNSLQVI